MPLGERPRTTVAVHPAAALAARPRLFGALEEAFPVRFAGGPTAGAEATVAFGDSALVDGRPALLLSEGDRSAGRPVEAQTADRGPLDRRLRSITLRDRIDGSPGEQPASALDVLATSAGRPVWTRTRGEAPSTPSPPPCPS